MLPPVDGDTELSRDQRTEHDVIAARRERIEAAVDRGVKWLLDLQNRDGGWPTFCRGWGKLPFDRSGADLTAHALRAIEAARLARALFTGFPGQSGRTISVK